MRVAVDVVEAAGYDGDAGIESAKEVFAVGVVGGAVVSDLKDINRFAHKR